MKNTIYKIVPRTLWQKARESGVFEGAPVDMRDGYIHFSTASQVRETARLHFAGAEDLLLVAVDGNALGLALKFEPSRNGELFPHLYARLPMDAVEWERTLSIGADGLHVFPKDVL